MYIYIEFCTYIYIYICVYTFTYIYMYTYAYIYISMHILPFQGLGPRTKAAARRTRSRDSKSTPQHSGLGNRRKAEEKNIYTHMYVCI